MALGGLITDQRDGALGHRVLQDEAARQAAELGP
jgi:hypothetical protein